MKLDGSVAFLQLICSFASFILLQNWVLFFFRIKNTTKQKNSAAQFFDDKIKWNIWLRIKLYAAGYIRHTWDLHYNY